MNIESDNKYCFLWSLLANIHRCDINHPDRVSNYRQNSNELNIQDFVSTNKFKSSDVHIFVKLNNLSTNLFELNFYEAQNKWKHKLILLKLLKMIHKDFLTCYFIKIFMFSLNN